MLLTSGGCWVLGRIWPPLRTRVEVCEHHGGALGKLISICFTVCLGLAQPVTNLILGSILMQPLLKGTRVYRTSQDTASARTSSFLLVWTAHLLHLPLCLCSASENETAVSGLCVSRRWARSRKNLGNLGALDKEAPVPSKSEATSSLNHGICAFQQSTV